MSDQSDFNRWWETRRTDIDRYNSVKAAREGYGAGYHSAIEDSNLKLASLEQENKELREALEFYAETTGWENGKKSGEASFQRARSILAKYKK